MNITATIKNSHQSNEVIVSTNEYKKTIPIPAKEQGGGSAVNGGELLFLALATCFCNDIYREAAQRQITIQSVEVQVSGQFGKEGEPASGIQYEANNQSSASSKEIEDLIKYVDSIAEIHNTLRKGVTVSLKPKD